MKIIFVLIFAVFMSNSSSRAQQLPEPLTLNLWSDMAPKFQSILTTAESVQPETGHVLNSQTGQITVFLPAKEKNTGRSVLICPGGGYGIIAIEHEGYAFARFLAENGIAGIVLRYRIPMGVHQIPLEDAQRALVLVRQRAQEWGLNPRKVGVMGFSAGGHLASTLSVRADPDFSILFYPVVSMSDTFTHAGSRESLTGGDTSLYRYYSNELQVTPATPAALLFHSSDDTGVPIENSQAYRDALLKVGVAAELVVYPTGGHGWGFADWFESKEDMKHRLLEWINKQ